MPKIELKDVVGVRVMVRIDIPKVKLVEVSNLQADLMVLTEQYTDARLEVSMLPVTETRD